MYCPDLMWTSVTESASFVLPTRNAMSTTDHRKTKSPRMASSSTSSGVNGSYSGMSSLADSVASEAPADSAAGGASSVEAGVASCGVIGCCGCSSGESCEAVDTDELVLSANNEGNQ